MNTHCLLHAVLISGFALAYAQSPADQAEPPKSAASAGIPAAPSPAAQASPSADAQAAAPGESHPGALTCTSERRRLSPSSWSISITFPVPMIEASAIGSDASRAVQMSGGLGYRASWSSRNSLFVETDPLPLLQTQTLSLHPDLRGPAGEVLEMEPVVVAGGAGSMFLLAAKSPGFGMPVFLCSWNRDQDETLAGIIDRLYCLTKEKQPRRLPVKVRPATRGDVLLHWDMLCDRLYDLRDTDRALFETGPADEPLQGLWCVELPPDVTEECTLILPEAGYFDTRLNRYTDGTAEIGQCTGAYYALQNRRTGPCRYEVELQASPGLDFTDPLATLGQLKWEVWEQTHADKAVPMNFRDGAFRASIRGKELVLTPDLEASRPYVRMQPQPDGSTRPVCSRVIWRMDNGNRHVRLSLAQDGGVIDAQAKGQLSTLVAPRKPRLRANASFGSLTPGNQHPPTLSCTASHADNLRIRAWRLDNSPQNTVRTLRAYRTYYHAGELRDPGQQLQTDASRLAQQRNAPTIVPTELLPGVIGQAQKELTLVDRKASVTLQELFPDAGRFGLYFVEFESDAANDGGLDDTGGKVLTQSLVQVTDLGLMWKSWKGHAFIYAYRLSDGRPLQEGTLRLLDTAGNTLSEHALSGGTLELAITQVPAYLQITSGEDSYITEFSASDYTDWAAQPSDDTDSLPWRLVQLLRPAEVQDEPLPLTSVFTFSDRRVYRPGETAHLRGYVRDKQGNRLSIPELDGITATISSGGTERRISVTPEAGGAFSLDVPLPEDDGDVSVRLRFLYRGDTDGTSPLMRAIISRLLDAGDREKALELVRATRQSTVHLAVSDFRRNEFEVESQLDIHPQERTATVSSKATRFNTAPVSHGKARWLLRYRPTNFYPEAFRRYRFGDHTDTDYGYYRAYYGLEFGSYPDHVDSISESELDEHGKGAHVFRLPAVDRRLEILSSSLISDSAFQSIEARCRGELHPAEVYVGIREGDRVVRRGESIPIHCLLVDTAGKAWQGEPLTGSISVKRTEFRPYRIGNRFLGQVKEVEISEDLVSSAPITLRGTASDQPDYAVETPKPGFYEVTVRGQDTHGRPFRSAVKYWVFEPDDARADRDRAGGLQMIPNRDLYKAGETALIYVGETGGGELLVTVEREGVLRYFRTRVNPVTSLLEVPLLQEDQPGVRITAFLVHGADDAANDSGKAIILSKSTVLAVDPTDRALHIELTPPATALRPETPCTVSGTVRDAQGKPVPHAAVTLYAVDEGTLQVHGYGLPNPLRRFFRRTSLGVKTWNSRRQLIGEALSLSDYGNKGVFIGGGGEDDAFADESTPARVRIRENFTPCALWLANMKTDAEGRFQTTYRNPDTLTRYRLMAVAAAGDDRFGQAQSSYDVNQPVMLEPQVPLATAQGDTLDLPLTLSMQPQQIPGLSPDAVLRFRITAEAQNATLPETSRTVELRGNAPVTVTLPVQTPATGTASLTWSVQLDEEQPSLPQDVQDQLRDAVTLRFPVEPVRPWLREYINLALEPGQTRQPSDFVTLAFAPESELALNFSTHPLTSLAGTLRFLFSYPHGCTEQISSALLPWLLASDLSRIPGVTLPADRRPNDIVRDGFKRIGKRLQHRDSDRDSDRDTGFSYWERGDINYAFTPYIDLILHLAEKRGYPVSARLKAPRDTMKKHLLQPDQQRTNLLALLPLALEQKLTRADLDTILGHHPQMREDALWCAACAAALIGDRERADALAARAREARKTPEPAPTDPNRLESTRIAAPADVLSLLFRHYRDPQDATLTADACTVLREHGRGRPGTWQSGWCFLLLDALLDHHRGQGQSTAPGVSTTSDQAPAPGESTVPDSRVAQAGQQTEARLNGQPIPPDGVVRTTATLQESDHSFTATGGTVYACGTAEGYLKDDQPDRVIDHGFVMTRLYEVRQPNGAWKATHDFHPGDLVRITLHCRYTGDIRPRYVAIEDRLPSTFEAIDPQSPTQTLPPDLMRQVHPTGWLGSGSISHRSYGKNRARFYVDTWESDVTIRYVARVVRSGEVSIPAAKAEMMYAPQYYGLSTPEKIRVTSQP